MNKLKVRQWGALCLGLLNLACLVSFIALYIPMLKQNYEMINNSTNTLTSTFSLISGISLILIVFLLSSVVNLVLYFLYFKGKDEYSSKFLLIFVFILTISCLLFCGFLVTIVSLIIQNISSADLLSSCIINLITSIFYVIFFSIAVQHEITLKNRKNESSNSTSPD